MAVDSPAFASCENPSLIEAQNLELIGKKAVVLKIRLNAFRVLPNAQRFDGHPWG
jgi:hypothetical protein